MNEDLNYLVCAALCPTVCLSVSLACPRQVLRKFRKSSDVRQLFLFVREELDGAKTKAFDVRTVRPPISVRYTVGHPI